MEIPVTFTPAAHSKYFKRFLQLMPPQSAKGDSQRYDKTIHNSIGFLYTCFNISD